MLTIGLSILAKHKGEWEDCAVKVTATTAYFDRDSTCWREFNDRRKVFVLPTPGKPATASAPTPPRKPGPGDFVKAILDRIGVKPVSGCGCAKFQAQMNEWDWIGCLSHFNEIIDWFAAKAKEQGITLDRQFIAGAVMSLIRKPE